MDRNTLMGLVLIFVILAGSVFLMKPSDEEIKKERERQALAKQDTTQIDSTTPEIINETESVQLDSTALAGPFGSAIQGEERVITLENELIRAQISTKGGRVKSVELKGETTYDDQPLILFDGDHNKFGLFFFAGGQNFMTNELYFSTEANNITVAGSDSR